MGRVENFEEKGQNAGFQYFLLPFFFLSQKASFERFFEVRSVVKSQMHMSLILRQSYIHTYIHTYTYKFYEIYRPVLNDIENGAEAN